MEPTDPTERLEFWRKHLRRVAEFDGTQGKYAELSGISASKLSYYKGFFNPKNPGFAKLETTTKISPQIATDLKAADRTRPSSSPDPVWMATFLREFLK